MAASFNFGVLIKRIFDIIASLIGIIILFPFFIIICLIMIVSCGFPLFYLQTRVGKHGKDFKLFKFRTMHLDADKKAKDEIESLTLELENIMKTF